MNAPVPQRIVAEFAGTALLLVIVVGSGIMGENLAGGNAAIALLANSIATGAGLYVLITVLGPISGAQASSRWGCSLPISPHKASAGSLACG